MDFFSKYAIFSQCISMIYTEKPVLRYYVQSGHISTMPLITLPHDNAEINYCSEHW